MSEESPSATPGRDGSGRFVSRKPTSPPRADDRAEWHPMARTLFGWTADKGIGGRLFWIVLLLAIGLIFADALVHHHPKFEIERAFGFYGLFGFAAFALVVLAGHPLGKLLRRDENYYGDEGDAPPQASKEDDH
jgi:hypothetical protein